MTNNIWVTSDQHWNHENILKFINSETGELIRPGFTSVEHMNELMIDRWNSCVKQGDKVYHLGDVVMGSTAQEWMNKNWPRLHGSKRLILGNHDSYKLMARGGWFSEIYESRQLVEFGLLLTHRPAHESQLWDYRRERPLRNLHGHIHEKQSPSDKHVNVCVEHTNYYPINIEELRIY